MLRIKRPTLQVRSQKVRLNGANGGCALLKRIPGDPKARRKILLLGLVDILTKRRGSWRAIERWRSSLEVLGVDDYAVAVIARARATESSSRYDWSVCRIPETGKKVDKQTIPIPRRD